MTAGSLLGGGSDPTTRRPSAPSRSSTPSGPRAASKLQFRPQLSTRVFGGRKAMFRAQNPKFRATLVARHGDANLRRAAVTLPQVADPRPAPHRNPLHPSRSWPPTNARRRRSTASPRATSPLIGKKLKGPVYLVPGNHILPDLLVDLRGQVNVRLRGAMERSRAAASATSSTWSPTSPVSQVRADDVRRQARPAHQHRSPLRPQVRSKATLKAQNGKRARNKRMRLKVPACGGKRQEARRGPARSAAASAGSGSR